jgi:hypothetical protein
MACLLALQIGLPAGHPRAAEPVAPPMAQERQKQEAILRSQDAGYVVDRGLKAYVDTLPPDFDQGLRNLGQQERWLDIGAGKAQAILDYFNADAGSAAQPGAKGEAGAVGAVRRKAKAVAISVEDRRTPLWHQTAASLGGNHIQYLYDKRLSEYSVTDLGRFQIITDIFGGFSYSEDLTLFMEKTLGFLETKGTFYTVLQDVHSEAGTNKPFYANSPYLTQITDASGAEVKVCDWLKRISCVEVACQLKADWKPPIEVYRIRKTCDQVSVPPLQRTHYQAGTPPERFYKLGN